MSAPMPGGDRDIERRWEAARRAEPRIAETAAALRRAAQAYAARIRDDAAWEHLVRARKRWREAVRAGTIAGEGR